MNRQHEVARQSGALSGEDVRRRLLAGIPIPERRLELAGARRRWSV
jgi:hypothetical protein